MNETQHKTTGAELSVVIPVSNQEAVLTKLFDRLYPVLDGLGIAYEVVFVDAGSRDRSATLLRQQYKLRPDVTQVLLLRGNAGRPAAVMAGVEVSGGDRLVTLDADPRHPPEAIPWLLAEMDRGHDYVGSFRRRYQDSRWRALVSKAMNRLRERVTRIRMTDPGCMPCAYDRAIVDAIRTADELLTPGLAYIYAANPTEIGVENTQQATGKPKYPLYESIHPNLDLMTGFSLIPLQLFSLAGIGIALVSFVLAVLLALRRLVIGPEAEGVFTLFSVLFFLVGMILFGIGLVGEYVRRLCEQSRSRPNFPVREHLHPRSGPAQPEV
ncbi:glycosyltransferase [Candidatus Thiosymbion oneisti]|uniref:glycosyltransferase n=1 Tax=Candidatus Thiosymbion oneisti TaxID=589554 RepID=UPI001C40406F|nr:glycosyltransferase [Candidatus Thiosymbion oneisti]